MRSGFARETGEPPRAGTVAERSAAAFTKSRRADARNDRPQGRSPSRKTGRIKSLGVLLPSGQPREPPFVAGNRGFGGRWLVPPLVLTPATLLLAACTPVGGSPARPSRVAECPVTLAFRCRRTRSSIGAGPQAIQAVRATRRLHRQRDHLPDRLLGGHLPSPLAERDVRRRHPAEVMRGHAQAAASRTTSRRSCACM